MTPDAEGAGMTPDDGAADRPSLRPGAATRSLLAMLRWDARVQLRYGVYPVYAVLTLLFVLGVRAVDPAFRTDATVLLVATDPAVLGFYFVAVLVLFETDEGVLDALVVSPLGVDGYLRSKVLSLSALATAASTVVLLSGHGLRPAVAISVLGVGLSSALFVSLGLVSVARFDSVNAYFLSAAVWGAVLFSPLLGYLGLVDSPLFWLLPVRPLLVLVEAGLRPVAPWQVAAAVAYLAVGNVVAYRWARRSFERHVVRGGDPGRKLGGRRGTDGRTWDRTVARSPWVGLLLGDLRNWVRDPLLAFAAVGPVLLAAVVRLAAPAVSGMAAGVVDLPAYYPAIAGTMTVFGPGIYGFVVAMFVLEDRDRGVLTVYRTSPLSLRGYLLYRATTAFAFGLLATLPAVLVVGLVRVPLAVVVASAALGALGGPVVALSLGLVAGNAIEGVALSKFANLLLLGPAAVVALVPEPWQFAAGVLPAFWPVKVFVAGATGDSAWMAYLVVGVVVHVTVLAGLVWGLAPRIEG